MQVQISFLQLFLYKMQRRFLVFVFNFYQVIGSSTTIDQDRTARYSIANLFNPFKGRHLKISGQEVRRRNSDFFATIVFHYNISNLIFLDASGRFRFSLNKELNWPYHPNERSCGRNG